MCDKASILPGERICDDCRKNLAKATALQIPDTCSTSDSESQESITSLKDEVNQAETIVMVNSCLDKIGETPVTRRKLQSKKYVEKKMENITKVMKKAVMGDTYSDQTGDEGEMVRQLKEKFSTAERSKKIQILTVLPKSWSIRKIQLEFGTSNFMARKAKELVKKKGILSSPDPKPARTLPQPTVDLVTSFYESDEISRIMPGKKDFVTVRKSDQRIQVQKRLVLCNLRELYRMFKDRYSDETIGFSKFACLRPKHCILAGASGTHSVCVCTIHQNVKLMMLGVKLPDLTVSDDVFFQTYHHCIAQMICNPPLPECYLGACSVCPGSGKVKSILTTLFDDNMIDNVTYKQWITVDRSTLETISSTSDEFIEAFCSKLGMLIPHSFIATQQTSFFNECRSSLKPGELLVVADFSENYSFILQDAAQGFHWNNVQATIHPFVIYYKHSGENRHLSYVVISDCLHHDTVAVYLFQKSLIVFLKEALPCHPVKITYFSDGAASQYKNRKNFINLCNHQSDFGIKAEWHFSATSHGKGACDGIGGTVKRLAARASLQRPYEEQIMTPLKLFEWASGSIPGTVFKYCSTEEYEEVKVHLQSRFLNARTIPGTRKLHSFVPLSRDILTTRVYSFSSTSKHEKVTKQDSELEIDEISGFVTCVYEGEWWLACVLDVDIENAEVTVSFLHPHGPSRSFKYPSTPDILTLQTSDILTKVSPKSSSRVYTVTQKEKKAATVKLSAIY